MSDDQKSLADVHCSYRRDIAHALGQVEFYRDSWDDLVGKVAAVKAELAEAKDQRDGEIRANSRISQELSESKDAQTRQAGMIRKLNAEAKAAPSLPAVDSPEGLRYAADVIEQTGGYNAEILIAVIRHLEHTADRLEREQAEKAERDNVIEQLTEALADTWIGTATTARPIAEVIADRFDITPKAES